MANSRILLVMLEFPNWELARPWSYSSHFGIEEGLRGNGVETVVLPILAGIPSSSRRSWLSQAQQLCEHKTFDQVWVWLVHTALDENVLEWIHSVAPIRVGLIPESLDHTQEELEIYPHLRVRKDLAFQQLQYFTHVLAVDEIDVHEINAKKNGWASWWTTMIPKRFLIENLDSPKLNKAVFYGSLYSKQRVDLVTNESLKEVLVHPRSTEDATKWPRVFDTLQEQVGRYLETTERGTWKDLEAYVDTLRKIRTSIWRLWLKELGQWGALVNLPTIGKCYASRVVEGMSVGIPCISWKVPDRPRNAALFTENSEILFFDPRSPESLLGQIQQIQKNPELGQFIARNALEKITRFHTAEFRVQQILQWIQTGEEVHVGEDHLEPNASVPDKPKVTRKEDNLVNRANLHTTVFIVTVGDLTFPACQEAIRLQDTQAFVLDVIRNVHPMSAAFQEMIIRCGTEYFIQVDEDMILEPTAVSSMTSIMQKAPDDIGMICFHLYDVDRKTNIQGVKIYSTAAMKSLMFRDVKACEMDLLEQMSQKGIRWILHPTVQGRHGTEYTPETIYRRYKSMYEKDIVEWNDVTEDIRQKATQFRETGNPLALFSLMGAVDGIVSAPYVEDQEKDFTKYHMKSLELFRRIFLESHAFPLSYENGRGIKRTCVNPPIPLEHVQWKSVEKLLSPEFNDGSKSESEIKLQTLNTSMFKKKRILLACQYFWPSVGGVETVVDNLGRELVNDGYRVDVATVAMPNRTCSDYQGMHIISLDVNTTRKFGSYNYPSLCWEFHQLLATGEYDACVLFANPEYWLLVSLLLGDISPRTKLFIQLLVNNEGFEKWGHDLPICERLTKILQKTDGALALTRQGVDAKFMNKVGISPFYLPNATTPVVPNMDFRETYGIPQEAFLIVHVANIWKVKNHLGLIRTLSTVPPNWKMVLIGMPYDKGDQEEMEYVEQVAEALQDHPEILYIPGLPREGIAAAMQTANVVLLASHAEISPMAIVEAMSYGTPWLATPESGDVADKAGGIVAPLKLFPLLLTLLHQHSELRLALGKLGFAHWQTCYSWSVIREGWIELLETGRLSKTFEMPKKIFEQMDDLQVELNEKLTSSLSQKCA